MSGTLPCTGGRRERGQLDGDPASQMKCFTPNDGQTLRGRERIHEGCHSEYPHATHRENEPPSGCHQVGWEEKPWLLEMGHFNSVFVRFIWIYLEVRGNKKCIAFL